MPGACTIHRILTAAFLATALHLPAACSKKPLPEEQISLPAPKSSGGGPKACMDGFLRLPKDKTFAQRRLYLEHKVLETIPSEHLPALGFPTTDISEIEEQSSSRLEELREMLIGRVERNKLFKPTDRWQAKRFFWGIRKVLERYYSYKGEDTLTLGLLEKRLDCDTGTSLYLDIGEHFGLPMITVDRPRHTYAGMRMGGKHVFFETTSGGVVKRTRKGDKIMDLEWSMYPALLSLADIYRDVNTHHSHPTRYYQKMAGAMDELAQLSLNPDDPDQLENFLREAFDADPNAAIECALECLEGSSGVHTANLYRLLAWGYFEKGDDARAIQALEKAAFLYSALEQAGQQSPELYLWWADTIKDLYFETDYSKGSKQEAAEKAEQGEEMCNEGLDEDPEHEEACDDLGHWDPRVMHRADVTSLRW